MSDSKGPKGAGSNREASGPLKRRGLLVGAGAAGVAVLAAKALPVATPIAPVVAAAKKTVDTAGGYQLTDHVLRYYETTRT